MPETMPRETRACCIAHYTKRPPGRKESLCLGDGITVHYEPPFKIDNWWSEHLGKFFLNQLKGKNLFIEACSNSDSLELLERKVESLNHAILMCGHSFDQRGMYFAWRSDEKGPVVERAGTTGHYPRLRRFLSPYLKPDDVSTAGAVARGIRSIYSDDYSYSRIKRGFTAWHAGITQRDTGARLHQFVRAVDAVVMLEKGEGRSHFTQRCKFFVRVSTGDDKTKKTLLSLYDLRSADEHLNGFDEVLRSVPEADRSRLIEDRAYQAELLAGRLLGRVFCEASVRQHFQDDDSTRKFWKELNDDERRAIWGPAISLDELMDELQSLHR